MKFSGLDSVPVGSLGEDDGETYAYHIYIYDSQHGIPNVKANWTYLATFILPTKYLEQQQYVVGNLIRKWAKCQSAPIRVNLNGDRVYLAVIPSRTGKVRSHITTTHLNSKFSERMPLTSRSIKTNYHIARYEVRMGRYANDETSCWQGGAKGELVLTQKRNKIILLDGLAKASPLASPVDIIFTVSGGKCEWL
jgi:hypothetical protein